MSYQILSPALMASFIIKFGLVFLGFLLIYALSPASLAQNLTEIPVNVDLLEDGSIAPRIPLQILEQMLVEQNRSLETILGEEEHITDQPSLAWEPDLNASRLIWIAQRDTELLADPHNPSWVKLDAPPDLEGWMPPFPEIPSTKPPPQININYSNPPECLNRSQLDELSRIIRSWASNLSAEEANLSVGEIPSKIFDFANGTMAECKPPDGFNATDLEFQRALAQLDRVLESIFNTSLDESRFPSPNITQVIPDLKIISPSELNQTHFNSTLQVYAPWRWQYIPLWAHVYRSAPAGWIWDLWIPFWWGYLFVGVYGSNYYYLDIYRWDKHLGRWEMVKSVFGWIPYSLYYSSYIDGTWIYPFQEGYYWGSKYGGHIGTFCWGILTWWYGWIYWGCPSYTRYGIAYASKSFVVRSLPKIADFSFRSDKYRVYVDEPFKLSLSATNRGGDARFSFRISKIAPDFRVLAQAWPYLQRDHSYTLTKEILERYAGKYTYLGYVRAENEAGLASPVYSYISVEVSRIPTYLDLWVLPKLVQLGETVTLTATLKDELGRTVSSKPIHFWDCWKDAEWQCRYIGYAYTDRWGVAELRYAARYAPDRDHIMKARFWGDRVYEPSPYAESTLRIERIATHLSLSAEPSVLDCTKSTKLKAVLKDKYGKPINDNWICIYDNTSKISVGCGFTKCYWRWWGWECGALELSYTPPKPYASHHHLRAEFEGNGKYKPSRAEASIYVRGPDLELRRIEPTQAVFRPDIDGNGILDLVKDRYAAALAYIEGERLECVDQPIKISFKHGPGYKYSKLINISPGDYAKILKLDPELRFLANPDLKFHPRELGSHPIKIELDPFNEIREENEENNAASLDAEVKDTKGYSLSYLRVSPPTVPPPPHVYAASIPEEYNETLSRSAGYIEGVFPVADREFKYTDAGMIIGILTPPGIDTVRVDAQHICYLSLADDAGVGIVGDGYFSYHDLSGVVGISFPNICGVLAQVNYWTVPAHELFHLHQIGDEYPRLERVVSGFWVKKQEFMKFHSLMWYAPAPRTFEQWVARDHYEKLFNKSLISPEDTSESPIDALFLGGYIFLNGTPVIEETRFIPELIPRYTPPPGIYAFNCANVTQVTICERSFSESPYSYIDPYGMLSLNYTPFGFGIPLPDGTYKLNLIKLGSERQEILGSFYPMTLALRTAIKWMPEYAFLGDPQQCKTELYRMIDQLDRLLDIYFFPVADVKLQQILEKLREYTVPYKKVDILQFELDQIMELINETSSRFWIMEFQKIPAMIDVDPDNLNLKSQGKWITAYIEIPGYDVSKINLSLVTLNYTIWAENSTKYGFVKSPEILDRDGDGYPELMVKFDREKVIRWLEQRNITSGNVTLVISGSVEDLPFRGEYTIGIIHGEKPMKQGKELGKHQAPGQQKAGKWTPPGQERKQEAPHRQEESKQIIPPGESKLPLREQQHPGGRRVRT